MAFMGIFLIIFLFTAFIMFIGYLMRSIGYMLLFTNAYNEKGWKGFIPFYGTYLLYTKLQIVWLFFVSIGITIIAYFVGKSWMYSIWTICVMVINGFVGYKTAKELDHPLWLTVLSVFMPDLVFAIHGIMELKKNETANYQ